MGLLDRLRGQAGITIVEVAVTSALLGIVVPVAINFLLSMQRNEQRVREATEQEHDARLGVETLSRSLREAGYPEGYDANSSSMFVSATNEQVVFYSDPDSDGVNERITFRLIPAFASIERVMVEPNCTLNPCSYTNGATSATRVVVDDVRNDDLTACDETGSLDLFSYYKVDRGTGAQTLIPSGSELGQLVDINHVKLAVVTDVTPGESPTCQTLQTGVSLRNWRGS